MRKAYKIVFLGNTSVGKTTLISQYLYHKVQAPTPTIGIDFLSTTLEIQGKQVRLQLWDTAGQERFQSIIGNYTRNTFIAVIVYAIDDRQSFERVKSWIDNFVLTHNEREEVRLLIVANKTDLLVEGFDPEYAEARALADTVGARFVTASAISTTGIRDMVGAINDFIAEQLQSGEEEIEGAGKFNALQSTPRSRRCC
ncbi:Ras-related protein Rab-6A [Pancytospora philotis]|nr:Ras-related protein Rab-6A [Pancytospora philotis]